MNMCDSKDEMLRKASIRMKFLFIFSTFKDALRGIQTFHFLLRTSSSKF